MPYRSDIWNKPKDVNKIYTNEGNEPLSVTYGKSGDFKKPPLPPVPPQSKNLVDFK